VRDDLERDESQHAANDDALHYVRDDVPLPQGRERSEDANAILRTTWLICIRHISITARGLSLSQNLFQATRAPLRVWI
jgi:hypothetical protein